MSGTDPLLEHLNGPQREAVAHGEKALLVLAGPGSGKTTVIVKRIQYLICRMHVPPEQILVITFTKAAALSMQQRFQEQVQQRFQPSQQQSMQAYPVNFGTFHSVFYNILRQSQKASHNPSHVFGSADSSGLLTEPQKKSLLIPLLKEIRRRAGGRGFDAESIAADAGDILGAISFYKNTEDEAGASGRLSPSWRPYFREIFNAYQDAARRGGMIDFDDMVYECRRLLQEDAALRASWQGRFSHILIDEFQDINPLQYQVIKLLARAPYNLFAVGDDDQSIYGFRGSRPACLRQFAEDFRAGQVLLDVNYRSRPEIVEASARVISENRERFGKKLRAADGRRGQSPDPVRILFFEERGQQEAYLQREITAFGQNNPGKSCAALFRTNTSMQSFGAGLARAGIDFVMREKAKNIYDHFIVKDLMAYLRLAAGERQRAVFLQVMNKPSRYLRRDAVAGMEAVDFQRMRQWIQSYGGVRRLDCLDAIDRLQTQLKAMAGMPLCLAVRYVCRAIGYERYLKEQAGEGGKLQEWLELLEWLREDARGYGTAQDWMKAQQEYGRTVGARDGAGSGSAPDAVQLMTVHAAKGLEFDKVWIPDCNEKVFPYGSMQEPDAVEEERRIFYVGMTRAKESLELLCLTGTGERPRLMSRFLNPIVKDYSSSSSSNSQLS